MSTDIRSEPRSHAKTPPFRMGRVFHDTVAGSFRSGLFGGARPAHLDPLAVRAWLSLGFVPGDATILAGIRCLPGGADVQSHRGTLSEVRRAAPLEPSSWPPTFHVASELFEAAVGRALDSTNGPHVVPLSGGLDSRVILGALLERLDRRDIFTVTYGVPGSADFEIGNEIARRVGVKHLTLDLSRPTRWDIDDLAKVADLTDANNSVFHPSVWLQIADSFGADATYWTGYTGDGIGGSFSDSFSRDASDPVAAFLRHELGIQAEWSGKASVEDLRQLCVSGSVLDRLVSPTESTWFANHVERYTTHHIFLRGFRYAAPFMAPEVVRFFCGLPPEMRAGKQFFNAWASRRWPVLFEIRTKDYHLDLSPASRWRRTAARGLSWVRRLGYRLAPDVIAHPGLSYRHYEAELRRGSLRDLVLALLVKLDRTDVWHREQWGPLWTRHQAGERFGTVLLNGASLGVVLHLLEATSVSGKGGPTYVGR